MTTRLVAVARAAARLLARTYLAFVLGLVLWSLGPALVLGWQSTVVTSGSMAPLLPEGGVLVSSPTGAAGLSPGQVVLFADPARDGGLVSHRVVGRDDDGRLRTRGDANASTDSMPVADEDVRAVGRLYVPLAGRPLLWVWQAQWLPLLVWSALTTAAALVAGRPRPGPGTRLLGHLWRTARRHGRTRRLLAATGTTAVVVLSLAGNPGQPAPTAVADPAGPGRPAAAGPAQSRFASLAAFTGPTRNPANVLTLHPSAQFGTSNYGAAVLADSPFIYYRLDEATGTTAANAGSGAGAHSGTYGASQVTYGVTADATPREGGSAVTLAGSSSTNGCIRNTRLISAPPTFSLEVWFRTTTVTGGPLVGFGNSAGVGSTTIDRLLYLTPTGQVRFGVDSSTKLTITSAAGLNDDRWHHAVGTLGPAGTALYVDGVQVATDPRTATGSTSGYWNIGCDQPPSGWTDRPANAWFAGSVDNVAIYSTVLTPTRVQAHWFGA